MNPISEYLQRKKLTQTEFAERIGVSQSAVHQYITGHRPVSGKVCVRIDKATNGELSRKALRSDWAELWPELRDAEQA